MTTIGTQLSAARKQQGWSVESVSFKSKIRPSIIENLEADNYSQFSSESYAKSFLRKYSEMLGLDLENEIQDLLLEEPETDVNRLPQERVKESLESAEFSKKSIRFRKAQRTKGSPIFLIGSVIVLATVISVFYYLGSQANKAAEEGEQDLVEGEIFSRSKAASNNPLRSKDTIEPIAAPISKAKPMASSIPSSETDPGESIDPLSDY